MNKMNNKSKNKNIQGFTLIELLVVVSMMGLLMSIVMSSFTDIKQKSLVSKAKAEVSQLRIAFELYFNDRSDYPPFGRELCSGCTNPPTSAWLDVAEELTPYMQMRLEKDPWGNYFAYDKNYKQPCWNAYSVLCSAGPNGVMETNLCQQTSTVGGDDICVFFVDTD